jgi:hypothetical protein
MMHTAALVVGNDTPLIGEQAATRGRGATKGDERARREALSF